MKYFSFLNKEILSEGTRKVIPQEEASLLLEGKELVEKMKEEVRLYREEVTKEAEEEKERSRKEGFEEGLNAFAGQIALMEKERAQVKEELEKKIVSLTMAALRKVLGKEIEMRPETIVDIVASGLKSISHHRRIKIFVNKVDFDTFEKERPRLKELFDHLETLTLSTREDVQEKAAIVETEAGILHVGLESQLTALEKALEGLHQRKEI